MKAKLPESERGGIEEALWSKSGERCFLCEAHMNRASEDLEADHDVPASEDGPTNLANLNLTHRRCNRAKRNAGSVPIKPFLKFKAYLDDNGGRLTYDKTLPHWNAAPKPVYIHDAGGSVTVELPDGSKIECPVFTDRPVTSNEEIRYFFADLPKSAIFSDLQVQPRVIQPNHAYQIYRDLQANPLYEPPGLRMSATHRPEEFQLLMFDGQHKTVAKWMAGAESIVAKIFINLEVEDAIELVNSIQAKVRKLPLSTFEFAAKMADEFANKMEDYESHCAEGGRQPSESGFVKWLPQDDRNRGREAFREALTNGIIADSALILPQYVRHATGADPDRPITETQAKDRLINKMLYRTPLEEPGHESEATRQKERQNLVRVLNIFTEALFNGEAPREMAAGDAERVRRLTYNESLVQVARLMTELYEQASSSRINPIFSAPLDDEGWAKLEEGVSRLVEHPVWKADFEDKPGMQRLNTALRENTDASATLAQLGLDLGYLDHGPAKHQIFKSVWQS